MYCTSLSSSGSKFNDIYIYIYIYVCVCVCVLYRKKITVFAAGELEITLQELSSTRQIIQILQEDVNVKPDLGKESTKEVN